MPLEPAKWELIQEIFHSAADLPHSEQRQFVEAQSAGDNELASAVIDMLEADTLDASILDRGLAHAADKVIDTGSASSHPLPTENFGAYHIVGVLGEGGMG